MRASRSLLVLAACALLIGCGSVAGPVTAEPLRFGKNVVVVPAKSTETGLTQGEPRIAVARDGTVWVGAHFQPFDCERGTHDPSVARPCVWVSRNGGRTFKASGGEPGGQAGNDVDLAIMGKTILESTMTNLRIQAADDVPAANAGTGVFGTTVSRSTDGGRKWTEAVDVNWQVLNDRPYLLPINDDTVFLTFTAPPGDIFVTKSTDQGATFGPPQRVTKLPPQLALTMNLPPIYDRARREIVLPYAAGGPGCLSGSSGCANEISVARSRDGGRSWKEERIVALPSNHGLTSIPGLAADAKGREYVVYADATLSEDGPDGPMEVFMVRSAGRGKPWSRPSRVDARGRTGMLASVAAGGDGHVAVAWYAADEPDAQTTPRPWVLRVAMSRNAGTHWSRTNASDHVVYSGMGVDHMAHLWDIIGIAVGHDGRLHVVWGDLRGRAEGQAQIVYTSQVSGAQLR